MRRQLSFFSKNITSPEIKALESKVADLNGEYFNFFQASCLNPKQIPTSEGFIYENPKENPNFTNHFYELQVLGVELTRAELDLLDQKDKESLTLKHS